jgi:predicted dehydrogenase
MKIAVIGSSGKMGRYHVKALVEQEHTVETCDIKYKGDYKEIDTNIFDKVIVATPTSTHYKIAGHFLLRGIDTFIEKPICHISIDAIDLLRIAKRNDVQLMVGHIENYNPVIEPLYKLLSESPPTLITTIRNGFADRVTEYNPVMDLMIHDIGIALKLIGGPTQIIHVNNDIYQVSALVEYNDIPVVHKVNMLSNTSERRMLVTQENGNTIDVDLLSKKINNHAYQGDALRLEQRAFLGGCRNGPMAATALEICEGIICQTK